MLKFACLAAALATVLGTSLASAAQKAAGKPNPLAKLDRSVTTLFKNADANKDGSLTQAELKKIEKPLANKLREFSEDEQIVAAVTAEHAQKPDVVAADLDGNDAITAADFRSFVMEKLSSRLLAIQAPAVAIPQFPRAAANNFNRGDRVRDRDDRETPDERRRREDELNRERQARRDAERRFWAARERDSFRPTPPPQERPQAPRETSREPSRAPDETKPKTGAPGNKR
jgi:hypothetical protein